MINKLIKALTSPRLVAQYLWCKAAPYIKNDRLFIKVKYRLFLEQKCNLDNPKTFQEKLQWIKLNDRKEIYHQMVDKVEVKKFIAEMVGEEYVIPTIGVYDRFEDIDFDALPNEFIIKNTHDSGSYYICTDKSKLDKEAAKEKLDVHKDNDYYIYHREWPYKGLKHRIIIEPLLHDDSCPYLRDFKFYTFNGEPKLFYVTSDKGMGLPTKQDFFDCQGNHLEIQDIHYPNNPQTPSLPINLEKMVEFSRILAKDTYHLRVDFYEVNGLIYVGEMTFFEGAGFCAFTPEKYNCILGDWIAIPELTRGVKY